MFAKCNAHNIVTPFLLCMRTMWAHIPFNYSKYYLVSNLKMGFKYLIATKIYIELKHICQKILMGLINIYIFFFILFFILIILNMKLQNFISQKQASDKQANHAFVIIQFTHALKQYRKVLPRTTLHTLKLYMCILCR